MAENEIEARVLTIVSDFFHQRNINPDSGLLLSLSGGVDSTALLYVMSLYRNSCKDFNRNSFSSRFKLYGLHVNHRLRSEDETEQDWQVLQKACALCNVPVERVSLMPGGVEKLAREKGCGLEAAARSLRYAALKKYMERKGCTKTILGHTADDLAETMITRFFQGSGTSGLHGIPAVRDFILRPLLTVPKDILLQIVQQAEIPWITDSSNSQPVFQRNRVRNFLVPQVAKEFPAYRDALVQSSRIFQEDEEILKNIADERIPWTMQADSCTTDAANFFAQPVSLRLRSLFTAVNRTIPEAERISKHFLLSMAGPSTSSHDRILLEGAGICIFQRGSMLILSSSVVLNRKTRYLFRIEYGKNGPLGKYVISWKDSNESPEPCGFSVFIPECRLNQPLFLRSRRLSDTIKLSGKYQKLKGIFNAMKVPESQRDAIPVLQLGPEVFAIPGSLAGLKDFVVRDLHRSDAGQPGMLLNIRNGV